MDMLDWIMANKEWVFSGAGVATFAAIFSFIWARKKGCRKDGSAIVRSQSIGHVSAKGNVSIHQTMGRDEALLNQAHQTLIGLRQMPGRLQEAVNSGAKHIAPTEARNELEKLFAVASAKQHNDLVAMMAKFQERFNGYLTLLNHASLKEVSIDEINEYHRVEVVAWFEGNIIGRL